MSQNFSRRDFMKSTSAGVAAISTGLWTGTAAAKVRSVNEGLNIACVGTANRALADINGVATENLVAFVDVDTTYLGRIGQRFPEARKYSDYREMLDAEKGKIDAVVVATTDHHHAPATIRAIRQGLHVYCEKPLTHTVQEARIIAEAAKEHGVATQMGTQIHAGDNYRRVVEVIQSGAIGDVTEVHVWVGKGWGGGERPAESHEPPASLDWNLWLGPAPERPYHKSTYHPGQWRRWWDFGQGTLGDMGCHYMDLPFWALKLRHPTSAEATGPEVHPETCPHGLSVTYEFPQRGDMVPVKLTWSDGNMIPKEIHGQRVPANGVMFVGTEGMMFADYGKYRLFPTDKFSNFQPPEKTIPASFGHHQEWIKACKEGSPTLCNFDYSGALTETVLLGNVAYRTGKKLEWDAKSLTATNAPEAQQYIQKQYTKGWEVV
ncbi:MAG: Gfo/Idh/MocA family oxidoreductase [Planctomycetaceae bacterium]|nr:Gfo/Idh/MocA family oxidoreductase [Planctomycetaceae bacterium]